MNVLWRVVVALAWQDQRHFDPPVCPGQGIGRQFQLRFAPAMRDKPLRIDVVISHKVARDGKRTADRQIKVIAC